MVMQSGVLCWRDAHSVVVTHGRLYHSCLHIHLDTIISHKYNQSPTHTPIVSMLTLQYGPSKWWYAHYSTVYTITTFTPITPLPPTSKYSHSNSCMLNISHYTPLQPSHKSHTSLSPWTHNITTSS